VCGCVCVACQPCRCGSFMKSHMMSCDVMGCHGVSWDIMGCHGVSWCVMGCHGVSWDVMECHMICCVFVMPATVGSNQVCPVKMCVLVSCHSSTKVTGHVTQSSGQGSTKGQGQGCSPGQTHLPGNHSPRPGGHGQHDLGGQDEGLHEGRQQRH